MNDDWPGQPRAVEQIEKEFDGMLVHHGEQETARERFEALWDEVNAAAMRTLDTDSQAPTSRCCPVCRTLLTNDTAAPR